MKAENEDKDERRRLEDQEMVSTSYPQKLLVFKLVSNFSPKYDVKAQSKQCNGLQLMVLT